MREPILLVVQGMRTENDYFTSLRRKLGLSNVKIKVEADSPELMVKKTLKSIDHDKDAPFRAIYYIVDVDDTTDNQFHQAFAAAKRATTKGTQHYFVVSFESFDTWLLAHFEPLKGKYIPRKDMQAKLLKKKMLEGKRISADFPVGEYGSARQNVDICGFNELSRKTVNTAVPNLIAELVGSLV